MFDYANTSYFDSELQYDCLQCGKYGLTLNLVHDAEVLSNNVRQHRANQISGTLPFKKYLVSYLHGVKK